MKKIISIIILLSLLVITKNTYTLSEELTKQIKNENFKKVKELAKDKKLINESFTEATKLKKFKLLIAFLKDEKIRNDIEAKNIKTAFATSNFNFIKFYLTDKNLKKLRSKVALKEKTVNETLTTAAKKDKLKSVEILIENKETKGLIKHGKLKSGEEFGTFGALSKAISNKNLDIVKSLMTHNTTRPLINAHRKMLEKCHKAAKGKKEIFTFIDNYIKKLKAPKKKAPAGLKKKLVKRRRRRKMSSGMIRMQKKQAKDMYRKMKDEKKQRKVKNFRLLIGALKNINKDKKHLDAVREIEKMGMDKKKFSDEKIKKNWDSGLIFSGIKDKVKKLLKGL